MNANDVTFQKMRRELVNTVRHLKQEKLTPFLYGSFAICLYADKPVIQAHDIDLAFSSRQEHDQAVRILEQDGRFTRVKQITWESDTGEQSVNTKLRSPHDIEFDLSYSRGDIELTLDPERAMVLNGVVVPILSLEDLQKSYRRFFNEKPDSARKIEIIEKLKHK